jgi:hypothetical protein
MERNENEKIPIILDFNINWWEAAKKLEAILCTSPWNQRLSIYGKEPNETKLMIDLLIEGAVAIGEVYYTPEKFTEDISGKAQDYLHYLSKKQADYTLCTIAALFSKHEIDVPLTDRLALYFPKIEAYVRCGDFSPEKIFEYLKRDYCKRVIIVNGAQPDDNSPEEAFYSFELRAPKEYIIERLSELNDKLAEEMREALEKAGINDIIPKVKFLSEE